MKWNELLEWINMNVNSEEAIKEIGRGNGISLEELPASYSPIEQCTRSGVHYYAAKSRNQKTIALIQKKLGIVEGDQHVNQTKVQANSSRENLLKTNSFPQNILCNHKKEFYHGASVKEDMDKIALFDERLYYIECKNGQYYLCTSREDGSDIRQIRNIPCGYGVSVNSKGIILYPSAVGEHKSFLKENEYGYVLWLDFSGNLKKKYNIIPKLATWTDFISIDLYVYGQMIFWSIYENDEMGGSGCRSKAYYMDLEVGETYQIYEGRKNGRRVSDIYGTEKKIVFSLKNHGSGDKIWYLYDIYSGITESMDNQKCAPQNYVARKSNKVLDIRYFDMEKDIMWLYVRQNGGKYLCATRIQSGVQCEILQEYPIWKIPKEIRLMSDSYFDGQRFFVAETYYQLFSINRQGEMYNCNPGEKHGQCEKFIVLGNYLYADTNAQYIDSCFRIDAYNRIPKISQKVWFDRYN